MQTDKLHPVWAEPAHNHPAVDTDEVEIRGRIGA